MMRCSSVTPLASLRDLPERYNLTMKGCPFSLTWIIHAMGRPRMADEDAAAPRNRIFNVRTIPPHAARPDLFPPSSRLGGYNPTRSKEPLLRLWRRMLGRYWLPGILLWVAISGVVLTLTYYPLNLSFIDFRLVAAAAMITCAAAAIWGAFQWIEIRSGRVSDPDVLSDRMQAPVYTLPPLPTIRADREVGPVEADAFIHRFIERLDHVRFAIFANRVDREKRQCVLVTSAVRGEGRTTLAAQLAARCGNAGTSTLLIDADLRRPALNGLLDIADGPGLREVLAGKVDFHHALIPNSGGRVHLLRTGEPTPVPESLRTFQRPGIRMMIAKCRERFDLTIIDCGPVVPFPDALAFMRVGRRCFVSGEV